MEMEVGAFRVFPVEVWEEIMGNLEDSWDVLNTFKAYPELRREGVLKTKAHLWLFEQVVPHIFPWIKEQKLLDCRQVCRQWCLGVDNFMENHPDNIAFDHDNLRNAHLWMSTPSQKCYSLGGFKGWEMKRGRQFGKDPLESHPPARNPIVGRAIVLDLDDYKSRPDVGPMLKAEGLGEHIWNLTIRPSSECNEEFFQVVLDCLRVTPNLKGLKIASKTTNFGGSHHGPNLKEAQEFFRTRPLPAPLSLPNLESLEVDNLNAPQPLVDMLVTLSHTQIRRMTIPLHSWNWGYDQLLMNLTELDLRDVPSKDELVDLLGAVSLPKLWSLKLRSDFALLEGILHLLVRFPKLQHLLVAHENITLRRSGMLGKDPAPTPSIKSLELLTRYYELDMGVLQCFPSLECLTISPIGSQFIRGHEKVNLAEAQMWELLAKLKEIRVKVACRQKRCCMTSLTLKENVYSRARLEYLQSTNSTFPSSWELETLV